MQLQSAPHGCGPAAVVNALEALGLRATQAAVAKLARTDAEGTDEAGMKRALRLLGTRPEEISTQSRAAAWHMLCGALLMGYPLLMTVDRETHWVAAVGLLGGNVLIADSADGGIIRTLGRRALLERWASGGKRPSHYAIAVHPQEE